MKNAANRQLTSLREECEQDFRDHLDIETVLINYTAGVDQIVRGLWQQQQLLEHNEVALIAVGGYGRRELSLHSDLDILVLHQPIISHTADQQLSAFIQVLWDCGLKVGQLISRVDDCLQLASEDVSVISNLLDHRFLLGDHDLYQQLLDGLAEPTLWPSNKFFQAKWKEQLIRYDKYRDTTYSLEPNVKNSPGGLRDLQMIIWVAQRHYGGRTLAELLHQKFLTQSEYQVLLDCRRLLLTVRFALHCFAHKTEDRILFNYQQDLAALLGDTIMTEYFKAIKVLREFNDMLLQLFRETILTANKSERVRLDDYFQIRQRYIEVCDDQVFFKHPSALLLLFIHIAEHGKIQGVQAATIRLIHQARRQIAQYRNDPNFTQYFLQLLRQPKRVFPQLQRMSRYGVLAEYIPEYAQVTGQMQYDLYHVYTVDQHSLLVIRYFEQFRELPDKFPICHRLIEQIDDQALLYIAGLFHDMGKGRGGDHSILGADDVVKFCQRHGFDAVHVTKAEWLVRHHLLFSYTAQRQDIDDPQTIKNFCAKLPSPAMDYLNHLYLLTVADICATNPSLWNSWRDTLFRTLYAACQRYLAADRQMDEQHLIAQRQQTARDYLGTAIDHNAVTQLWQTFKRHYFLFETPDVVANQSRWILEQPDQVIIKTEWLAAAAATRFFFYLPWQSQHVVTITTIFSNFHLNIHEARLMRCDDDKILDTFVVTDATQKLQHDSSRMQELQRVLRYYLTTPNVVPRLIKHRLRYQRITIKPTIEFINDPYRNWTRVCVIARDRTGLLATLSQVFASQSTTIHHAKIMTTDDRIEDVFITTNSAGEMLNQVEQQRLEVAVLDVL